MPGSQGEKETEVQDEATTRGAELLLTDARVRDVYGSMSQSSPAFNTTVPVGPQARDTPRAESDLLQDRREEQDRHMSVLLLIRHTLMSTVTALCM